MVGLQLLAARLAGVDKVVFHAVSQSGTVDFDEGADVLRQVLSSGGGRVTSILERFAERGLRWGTSDGN